jgi:gliding motility-associated-like protein
MSKLFLAYFCYALKKNKIMKTQKKIISSLQFPTLNFGLLPIAIGIAFLFLLSTFHSSAQGRAVLNDNVYIVIANSASFVVNNANTNAITTLGFGGNIISEGENNVVKWAIGNNTGNYIVPFTTTSSVKIPIQVNITTAGVGAGDVLFSTYRTANNNTIYPAGVTNLNACSGDKGLAMMDRFWLMNSDSYTAAPGVTLNIAYDAAEIGGTNTITEANLQAISFNLGSISWEMPTKRYGTANTATSTLQNGVIPNVDFHKIWTMVDTQSVVLSIAPTGISGTTTICSGNSTTLTLTGGSAGTGSVAQWSSESCGVTAVGGGTAAGSGNSITVSPTSNTTYFVRYEGACNITTCASQTVTVNPLNTIAAGTSQTVCSNSAIETISLATTGATGATFADLPAGVTGSWAANTVTISGAPSENGTFNYTVTTTGGCLPATATGTITVNESPTITVPAENAICVGSALNLSPTTGGIWSSNNPSIATITNGGEVTGVSQGTTEMVFTDTAAGCSSSASTGIISVNKTPILTIGEISCNKSTNSYSVGYTTDAGATITTSIGDVTSLAVTGVPNNQQVVITATTQGCPSVEEIVSTEECDDVIVIVNNGVSPNNDGLNENFEVANLEAYTGNVLSIYNRWGDKVYESTPYENNWSGQNNVGGIGSEDLPAGTYFYILELGEEEPIKGYIELKR